jgi:hypothetical protein
MMQSVRIVGLDVHKDSIAVAVAETNGVVASLGVIPDAPDSVRRLARKLGTPERLHLCYDAGPCGYYLYWQLAALGIRCDVVAPTLVQNAEVVVLDESFDALDPKPSRARCAASRSAHRPSW